MFCKYCGTENADNAAFCVNCDNELIASSQPEEVIVEPIPQPVAQPVVQPVAQPVYQPIQQPVQPVAPINDETVSFGDWFLTIFLMRIPLVNFILTLVFAFSSSTKKSKSNFFKAKLLWMVISTVLTILVVTLTVIFAYDVIEDLIWELGGLF